MILPPTLFIFIPAALLLLIFPGPSVMYISTRSISHGRIEGLKTVLGVELGGLTHAIFAAAGLSVILLESSLAFDIVKFAGAAYLLYLGVKVLLSRKETVSAGKTPAKGSGGKNSFINGYLVDLLNPKVALFFYAFLPQFVVPGAGSIPVQILFFGVAFALLGLITDSMYALFSSSASEYLSRKFVSLGGRLKLVTAGTYMALGVLAATSSSKLK